MDDRSKLVIISSINVSDMNAPAIHLLSLTKQLSTMDYEIVLIVPEYENDLPIQLPDANISVEKTKKLKLPGIPNSLSALAQIWALWRHRRCAKLYIRTGPLSFILSFSARLFGYRHIVMEVNGWLADELKIMGYPRLLASIYDRLQLAELKIANAIRVVTPKLKTLLADSSIDQKKIHIIENGTDIDLFYPLDRKTFRKEYQLSDEIKYLVFAGNLTNWQDLGTVFKAMSIVLAAGYHIEFIIIGDGREKERFVQEAEQTGLIDKIHFTGAKTPLVVNQYFNACDIGVAPFCKQLTDRNGRSPLKVRDYAAAGLPIVTSRFPGLEEMKDEIWLSLAEAENVDEFAAALIRQLEKNTGLERKTARDYAEKHFSWERVADNLRQLIN